MNILSLDKAATNQGGENLLSGLAPAPSEADAFAGSFESLLTGAAPGVLTIQTDGHPQSGAEQPMPSNATSNGPAVVPASAEASTETATIGNSAPGNTPETAAQERAGENGGQTNGQDQSPASDLDVIRLASTQAVQSVLMLAAPLAPLVAVKTKAGSAPESTISGIAAVGDSEPHATRLGRPIPSFPKSYAPLQGGAGVIGNLDGPGSSPPEQSSHRGIKLSGQWDFVTSPADNLEINALLPGISGHATVEGDPKLASDSVFHTPDGPKSGDLDGIVGGLPGVQKNVAPGSAQTVLRAGGAVQNMVLSSESAADSGGSEQSNSFNPSQRTIGSIEFAQPGLPTATKGLERAANSDGPATQLVSSNAASTQPEAEAGNPKPQSGVRIPSISQANKPASLHAGAPGIPEQVVKADAVSKEPAVTPAASSENSTSSADAEAAAPRSGASAHAAVSSLRSQDLQEAIRNPSKPVQTAAPYRERIQTGVTSKESATAEELAKPQTSHVVSKSVAAQPSGFPVQSLSGNAAATAGSNGDTRAAEAQNGFQRLSRPANQVANLAAESIPPAHIAGPENAQPAHGRTDPKAASLQTFTRLPVLGPLAGVTSNEAVPTELHTSSPDIPGPHGTTQPSSDTSRPPEQSSAGPASNGPDVPAEKTTRNELPIGASPGSERTAPADRSAVPADMKAVRVESISGGAVAKPEIRFPKLSRSANRGGIGDAQHPEHMVSTKDYEPRTELAWKNMPNSGRNDSPSWNGVRAVAANDLNRARVDSSAERMADFAISKPWLDHLEHARSLEGTSASGRTEAHLHARLVERIWSAIETFRSAGSNDWVVRIRPDQETELNLRLKMQENQLVIHAKLENGNWDALAPSWRDLQAHLANRGVQLQPLESSGDRSAWSQNFNPMNSDTQNQNLRQHADDEGRNFQDFRELDFRFAQETPARKKPQPAAKAAQSGNGWESWA